MSLRSEWCKILSLQQNIKEHISSQPAQFQWKFKQPAFTADSWETKEQFEVVIMFYRFEYSLSFKVAPKVAQYTSVDNKNNFFPTESIVCTYALHCSGAEWRLWVRKKRRWWGRCGWISHTLMLTRTYEHFWVTFRLKKRYKRFSFLVVLIGLQSAYKDFRHVAPPWKGFKSSWLVINNIILSLILLASNYTLNTLIKSYG